MSHPAFCGLSHQHLGELVAELAPRWVARCESGRHGRREDDRRREAGAGPKYELVFTDRLLVTLVHLRTGLTHEASGVLYEVGSPTIGQAILEVRPLLVDRGFAVPDRPGIRLRTLEDVFAYAASEDVTPWIDGMETQVRRPHAGRPGRRSGGLDVSAQAHGRARVAARRQGLPLGRSRGLLGDGEGALERGDGRVFRFLPCLRAGWGIPADGA